MKEIEYQNETETKHWATKIFLKYTILGCTKCIQSRFCHLGPFPKTTFQKTKLVIGTNRIQAGGKCAPHFYGKWSLPQALPSNTIRTIARWLVEPWLQIAINSNLPPLDMPLWPLWACKWYVLVNFAHSWRSREPPAKNKTKRRFTAKLVQLTTSAAKTRTP